MKTDIKIFALAQVLVISATLVVVGLTADWFVKRHTENAIRLAIAKVRDEIKNEFADEISDAKAQLRKDVAKAWAEASRTKTRSKMIGSTVRKFIDGVKDKK